MAILGERRSGKTTLLLLSAIRESVLHGKNVIIVANNNASASCIYTSLGKFIDNIPQFVVTVNRRQSNVVEFSNGGSIRIIPATSSCGYRGHSPDGMYLDEFDFWDEKTQSDFWKSTYPIVSARRSVKMLIASSRSNHKGIFSLLINGANEGLNPFIVDETTCHTIDNML